MALKDLSAAAKGRSRIETGDGGSFDVRGLSVRDIQTLMQTHSADVETAIAMWREAVAANAEASHEMVMAQVGTMLALNVSEFVASIIALAADEPAYADVVERLPFPVQLNALAEIGRLTFDGVGGVGNFVGVVRKLATGIGFRATPKTD